MQITTTTKTTTMYTVEMKSGDAPWQPVADFGHLADALAEVRNHADLQMRIVKVRRTFYPTAEHAATDREYSKDGQKWYTEDMLAELKKGLYQLHDARMQLADAQGTFAKVTFAAPQVESADALLGDLWHQINALLEVE